MREILFRGKSERSGEWLIGHYTELVLHDGSKDVYIHPALNRYGEKVNPESVGQYVGLDDAKGSMIYEGDIVELSLWPGSHFLGVVEWSAKDCAFHIRLSPNNSTGMRYNLTVRGNVHDNPELMQM